MKKLFLLSVMLGAVTLSAVAQDDDMYFVPTKKNVAREKASYGIPADTYYSGSSRSVDEYNRRWTSQYEVLPADTGDIISFAAVEGVYPDSLGDFALTQRMQRFDGYEPSTAYWEGYSQGRADSWGWHSPWYYSSFYPWYDSYWYWDPWYWDYGYYGGWYGGWHSPWYYGYYRPWYYSGYWGWGGGGGYYAHHYSPGTQNHGRMTGGQPAGFGNGRSHTFSSGTFGSSRTVGGFGGSRSSATRSTVGTTSGRTRTQSTTTYSNSNGNFGGSRSSMPTSTRSSGSYSSTPSSSSSGGGGSFGGSRSGGGGGGGSRSGGGSFGGGRR